MQIPDFDPNPSRVVGFGYNHCSADYKLFKIHSNSIYVYSLRNCSWRKVQDFTYKSSVGVYYSNGIQLNGALHWLCLAERGNPLEIVVFSLEDEKVWKIPMPTSFTDADDAFEVGVFDGCLCILTLDHVFWVMKEYGVNQSWTKLELGIPFLHTIKPLALLRNDEALLLIDFTKFVLYNTREGTYRDLVIDGVECFDVEIYVDSLVST
ncbi:F-box/kelch-repeat protein At3g06240-like [Cornus florida]|uniref:F-box/kelch-repeat protein At3g06240-like n=1 Tax=Cornus florida TaxID=4283 RepID=UPI00289D1E12|nr:F-box/kelch-repeat protein At3g06240-like [Cornus florida]